ncbi:MAG: FAD-dependent oxidoreductase [Clostridiales Family XIII bacterium]|jgi:NADPH-dependent glutamate synthase beta subunit-like oxidoreductase|nr:FAD-dependent oxidoreductase [Clostridiales Family XIII bacterium]
MKAFEHSNARTVAEAVLALGGGEAKLNAGGTELLGTLKDNILPEYPKRVVNLKTVKDLDRVREEEGALRIGALARLSDIAESDAVRRNYTALAQAARAVATPHIRDMGTIGGNIAQMNRCWYFRKPENRFNCLRKGGDECFALLGDHRYHSVFGSVKTGANPCTRACPAGTDIPAYLEMLRDGDLDGAARAILEVNPMPAITGRVCAHFCQGACNRSLTDEAVLIGGAERAVGDYIAEHPDRFYTAPTAKTGKSVAVIGAGPAGLSAAYFLRKAGNSVTVFDAKDEAGGMLMYAIPAYRLPKDAVRRYIRALAGMGIAFRTGVRAGEDLSIEALERDCDALCFATGAWKRPVLGIAGEELTVFGLDFLTDIGRWMAGKVGAEVLVAGGGNVAMDVAITAKRLGADKVTLVCLEARDLMPASAEEIARAEAEGIRILPSLGLSRVIEENGAPKGMELKRCLRVIDENGAFNPLYDETARMFVGAENILMAVGQQADLSFIGEKYLLQLNRRGLIDIAEESGMTSRAGVFAAGDAATGPATVIGSVASGRKAADGINRYMGVDGGARSAARGAKPGRRDTKGIQNGRALKLRELDAEKRRLDLEDSLSPTAEEAADEARRCLNCGCCSVHPSDLAPALIALDASIITDRREIKAEDFFAVNVPSSTVLERDEIITEIRIEKPASGTGSAFVKFAFRKSIDFPIVNCAVSVGGEQPRICLNAVAPKPYRAVHAERAIAGKTIDETLAEEAGQAAVREAQAFESNAYKLQLTRTMVKRALLAAARVRETTPAKRTDG